MQIEAQLVQEAHNHEDNSSNPAEIRTYTGLFIDPVKPDPEKISIVDIAHALSNKCRYGGHVPRFYSVAEHSLLVKRLMKEAGHNPAECFAGLMHDSEEAYFEDMPSPMKRYFPEYVKASYELRAMIWDKFGIDGGLYDIVRPFDHEACRIERATLWPAKTSLRPQDAKKKFLDSFMGYWWAYGKIQKPQ